MLRAIVFPCCLLVLFNLLFHFCNFTAHRCGVEAICGSDAHQAQIAAAAKQREATASLLTLTTADGRQHTVRLLKQSDIFDE